MTQWLTEAANPAEAPTVAERQIAARYLAATREAVKGEVQGLSEAQWNFKPAPDRWSIAEVMEHIAIIEGRIREIIGGMESAPADTREGDPRQVDGFVLAEVPQRYPRVQAPPRVSPIGKWAGPAALEQFLASRGQTLDLLAVAPRLRGRVFPHPIFGPWDGYQWILAAAAHSSRHNGQIREVKADPRFPGR
ncbi:MAG TPA: DinB family protein [Candidatus Binatia bacterium]|nr:DinB family protein [Candidatus Binatia bacterium]